MYISPPPYASPFHGLSTTGRPTDPPAGAAPAAYRHDSGSWQSHLPGETARFFMLEKAGLIHGKTLQKSPNRNKNLQWAPYFVDILVLTIG